MSDIHPWQVGSANNKLFVDHVYVETDIRIAKSFIAQCKRIQEQQATIEQLKKEVNHWHSCYWNAQENYPNRIDPDIYPTTESKGE